MEPVVEGGAHLARGRSASAGANAAAHDVPIRRLRGTSDFSAAAEQAIRGVPVRLVEYPSNSDIVVEDAAPGVSFFIVTGLAASYKIEGTGARQISSFHLPGDMPDLYTLHLGRADSSIAALRPTTIGVVSHRDLRSLCHANAEVCDVLWRATLIGGAVAREWVSNLGRRNALSRVAHLLCEIAARLSVVGLGSMASCPFPLTQSDLADATGLTTVHINRTLQELRQSSLIRLRERTLTIPDWEALAEVGGFDPNYLFLKDFEASSARTSTSRFGRGSAPAPYGFA